MFTGLVEELATVVRVEQTQHGAHLYLTANLILEDMRLGDSISVNGVCLTVVSYDTRQFAVDVVPETLRRSNLGKLRPGDKVNVERAMQVGARFGGHIVAGHADGTGVLRQRTAEGIAQVLTIEAPKEIMRYVVDKGSICVDGVSLTVMDTTATSFRISIIPHTGANTTLLQSREGAVFNLEVDVIAKYVEKLTLGYSGTLGAQGDSTNPTNRGVSLDFLQKHGFA